jgi:hypothetical protein
MVRGFLEMRCPHSTRSILTAFVLASILGHAGWKENSLAAYARGDDRGATTSTVLALLRTYPSAARPGVTGLLLCGARNL